jgi:histidinol-phosphate aminotransferase
MRTAVNENTKLIFIANPNNPTGTVVTKAELEELLDGLPPRVVVVLDQAYYEYVEDADSSRGLDYIHDHNVVILHTFSKAYALAGLRVGYGLARPELISYLQQVRGPFNVNMLAQAATIASLNDAEQVTKAREMNSAGKAQLYAAFEEMNLPYVPTQANFILVDCGRDTKALMTELLRHGVIVRTFAPHTLPTWIRVTIGTREMNERFIAGLKVVLNS